MKKNFKYDICIVGGCGRAGLPLAISFAHRKKRVIILDVSKEAVAQVRKAKMPFKEEGADQLLREVIRSGNLSVSLDPTVLTQSENVVLIIGTPLSAHLYPDTQGFFKVLESYKNYFCAGQLFILRSTVAPGTTQKVSNFFKQNKLKIDLAFCPERIAEGNAIIEISNLPQIISGRTAQGVKRAKELFSVLVDEMVDLSPEEAELAKLFANSWRYMRFAISNQFYMLANNHGLDFYRIHKATTYKYPRLKDMPTAGFTAGPCLLKDTMQLAAHSENNFFIGHAAMLINEGMPSHIVSCLKKNHSLRALKVGILGMAFKAESDDSRESLAFKLLNLLEREAKQVLITDPYLKDKRLLPLSKVVAQSDILILGAPHKAYRDINFKNKPVVDIWNFLGKGGLIQ